MSRCGGIHCPGCGDSGGGGAVLIGLAAVVIIGAVIARPVARAVSAVGHVVAEVLHVLLIAAEIAGIGAAAATAIALAVIITGRARRAAAYRSEERRETERATVAAILEREQLALRVWHAAVIPDQNPQITDQTGART